MKRKKHSVRWYQKQIKGLIRLYDCLGNASTNVVHDIDIGKTNNLMYETFLTMASCQKEFSNKLRELVGMHEIPTHVPFIHSIEERTKGQS